MHNGVKFLPRNLIRDAGKAKLPVLSQAVTSGCYGIKDKVEKKYTEAECHVTGQTLLCRQNRDGKCMTMKTKHIGFLTPY